MEHKCLKCGLIAETLKPVYKKEEIESIRNTGFCTDCRLEEFEPEQNN